VFCVYGISASLMRGVRRQRGGQMPIGEARELPDSNGRRVGQAELLRLAAGAGLSANAVRSLAAQTAMAVGFAILFGSLFVRVIYALAMASQSSESRIFAVLAAVVVGLFVLIPCWFLFLFAVHIKSVEDAGDTITVQRVFSPEIQVPRTLGARVFRIAIPSFARPYYEKGTLFSFGGSKVFVPDYLAIHRSRM
jgi:hypothetical protein